MWLHSKPIIMFGCDLITLEIYMPWMHVVYTYSFEKIFIHLLKLNSAPNRNYRNRKRKYGSTFSSFCFGLLMAPHPLVLMTAAILPSHTHNFCHIRKRSNCERNICIPTSAHQLFLFWFDITIHIDEKMHASIVPQALRFRFRFTRMLCWHTKQGKKPQIYGM